MVRRATAAHTRPMGILLVLGTLLGPVRAASSPVADDDLGPALRPAAAGDEVLSPRLAQVVLDRFRTAAAGGSATHPSTGPVLLTAWEHELLLLIASGYAYPEIASRLEQPHEAIEAGVSAVLRRIPGDPRVGR